MLGRPLALNLGLLLLDHEGVLLELTHHQLLLALNLSLRGLLIQGGTLLPFSGHEVGVDKWQHRSNWSVLLLTELEVLQPGSCPKGVNPRHCDLGMHDFAAQKLSVACSQGMVVGEHPACVRQVRVEDSTAWLFLTRFNVCLKYRLELLLHERLV